MPPWLRLPVRPTPISLALQGGGAHGAFTWGVLDALLADGRVVPVAASGTSAGALNAIVLADGLARGGREAARAALSAFWTAVGRQVPFELFVVGSAESPGLAPGMRALMHWSQLVSPAQLNPLGLNPLRDLLAAQVDFERLRSAGAMRLFVAATHANSGRLRLFGNHELGVDAALASACLPALQRAVVIDGEPYWDGGYSANPALFPLVRFGPADLMIVALGPLAHSGIPTSLEEIRTRTVEFGFHASYLRELQLLADARACARQSLWPIGRLERRLARLRAHLIDGQDELSSLSRESRLIAHLPFLERLRDLGRARANDWLARHGSKLGRSASADLGRAAAAPDQAA